MIITAENVPVVLHFLQLFFQSTNSQLRFLMTQQRKQSDISAGIHNRCRDTVWYCRDCKLHLCRTPQHRPPAQVVCVRVKCVHLLFVQCISMFVQCMYVCLYVCVYVCACMYVCMYMYIHGVCMSLCVYVSPTHSHSLCHTWSPPTHSHSPSYLEAHSHP